MNRFNKLFNYQNILEHIQEAGTIDENIFGGKQGGYFISQVPEELAALMQWLIEYKHTSFGNYLELNAESGGFTQALTEFIDINNIKIVDDNHLPISKIRSQIIQNHYDEAICDPSSPACRKALRKWGLKYDLVHLYGHNSFEEMQETTFIIKDFMADGGLLVLTNTKVLKEVRRWDRKLKNWAMNEFTHIKTIKNNGKHSGISVYQYQHHI
jgi:hypothetical protein